MVTGIECGEPRLPLTPLEAQHKEQLAAMLKEYADEIMAKTALIIQCDIVAKKCVGYAV